MTATPPRARSDDILSMINTAAAASRVRRNMTWRGT